MKNILVVDNHPMLLKFMANLLTRQGHRVVTAQDGLSALEFLEEFRPDVVFLDLVMPHISGKQLCRVIRSMPALENSVVVILSAVAAEENLDCRSLGADACIAKGPFDKLAAHVLEVMRLIEDGRVAALSERIWGREDVVRREITHELLDSRRHFEIILRNMSEGILELNGDARIVAANPAVLRIVDGSEERLLGRRLADLFVGEDRSRITALLARCSQGAVQSPENSPLTLQGRLVSLEIIPVSSPAGGSLVVILKDVTDRKRIERQLEQARKMEAVGTLAGGLAHDFNNLLMGVQGNVSLMLMSIDCGTAHYEKLKSIEKLVQSGAKLTSQLLGYARNGHTDRHPLDLNGLVTEMAALFFRNKHEIRVESCMAADLRPVDADQGQLEQVLMNLFVNAWQAMPQGGQLILKTANVTEGQIRSKVYKPRPGAYVLLSVTDTGVGMDAQIQERIFEPFFTTKDLGRGTGLGLASVYGIVKGHRGYIDVQSAVGQGTTFTLYLPASGRQVVACKPEPETVKGSGTVLLVDDEEVIVEVASGMLKLLNYTVLTARSGSEALSLFTEQRERIDLVILDMIIPDMDGAQIFHRLKGIAPDVKVLLASGYSLKGKAAALLENGCSGFIQKPFNLQALSQKLEAILGAPSPAAADLALRNAS
ncbi:MAG: response regulator [Desulfobacteraceae bacterium]|nr:response regulator [Desulfobacteraceae bacterium]